MVIRLPTAVLTYCLAVSAFLPGLSAHSGKAILELEEVIPTDARFVAKTFNGTWVSDIEFIYRHTEGIFKYNAELKESMLIVPKAILAIIKTKVPIFSPDLRFLLAATDLQTVFRHSTTSRFAVFDLATGNLYKISNHERLQLCLWGTTGHALAYVRDNDVYYVGDITVAPEPVRLTYNGKPGVVYNGIADWVYEEEVLGSSTAMWFSRDGSSLAVASFNDTLVPTYDYVEYGEPGTLASQYPTVIQLKYPKAGHKNPTVSLHVINLKQPDSGRWIELKAPVSRVTDDHILGSVTWASGDEVAVLWLNRRQNVSVLAICNVVQVACVEERIRTEPKGWIDITNPIFSQKSPHLYLDIEPVAQGEEGADEWLHVVLHDRLKSTAYAVSEGRKTVSKVVGWNEDKNLIYYLSTLEAEPWQRHLLVSGARRACVTCALALPLGRPCRHAQATSYGAGRHLAVSCQGEEPHAIYLYSSERDAPASTWEDNADVRANLEMFEMPKQMDMTIPLTGKFFGAVKFFLPPELDISKPTQAYAMVVNVYLGPNSVRVQDTFSVGYHTYMATNRSVIYCLLEGRGSGNKGQDQLFAINNKLGSVEIFDAIDIVTNLVQLFPWIDANRIGIWGWSYGGFATTMILAEDANKIFKCGIAVAPVTSWIYYDTIYTERYMGLPTPEDNLSGYNASDTTRKVEKLRGRNFFLIHGSGDDNVHYQNSMALSRALELADIPFKSMSYPDEAHGLYGVQRHLYHAIDQFWTDCFLS